MADNKLIGVKHLIECHCVLPQYRNAREPVYHKFIVFSVIDGDNVQTKFVRCNNCHIVHKVYEINRSEIIHGKEELSSITTIDDIRHSLNSDLVDILEAYNADIATWEMAQFMLEQKIWNKPVILKKEESDGVVHGKNLLILDPVRFKIESFSKKCVIKIS